MAKSPKIKLEIDGKDNTKQAFSSVEKSLTALETKAASVSRGLAGLLAGAVSIGTLKTIADINSEWVDMSSRLRRVTDDEEQFLAVTERLGEVAESTWTGLNETIESFLGMQGPLQDLGYTINEQVNFVSALNNALVISGAKAEVAASLQGSLTKAMAAGKLSGQNLNNVIQRGGYVADLLAERLGVATSELGRLGKEGKITSQVIYEALAPRFEEIAAIADKMPATVADAMGRVGEAVKDAFRDEDLMEPLTDALLELANVLREPEVQAALANFAAAMVRLAEVGVHAGTSFVEFGQGLAFSAAKASGNLAVLDDLEMQIKTLQKSLSASSWAGRDIAHAFMTREEMERALRVAQYRYSQELQMMTGMTQAQRDAAKEQATAAKQADEEQSASKRKLATELKGIQNQIVADAKTAADQQLKVEKELAKEIEGIKKERLDIEKTYRQALAELSAPAKGDKEGTYADAQLLKVQARQALIKGDIKEAQEYARGALNILLEIKRAGGNTFGFEGFAKELESIELAANEAEKADAEKRLKKATESVVELAALAEKLGDIKIGFDLDQSSYDRIREILKQLSDGVVVTPKVEQPTAGQTVPVKIEAQVDEEPVKQKIYRIGNTFTDKPLTIPLEPEKIEPEDIQQAAGDTEIDTAVELDQASVTELETSVNALLNELSQKAVVPVQLQAVAPSGEPAGYATGGYIRGAGTGTSDSILARLSNGEYVVKAAAVRKYGLGMLHALNNMDLPKFATGGLVDHAASVGQRSSPALGTLNFNLPHGESFSVQATADNWGDLRRAALKYGKPKR